MNAPIATLGSTLLLTGALCAALQPRMVLADTTSEVAPGVTYIVTTRNGLKVHVVTVDRSHREYELRVLANEQGHSGSFLTDSVAHLAATSIPPAVVAINGYFWGPPESNGTVANQQVTPLSSLITNYDVRADYFSSSSAHSDKRLIGFAPSSGSIQIAALTPEAFLLPANEPFHHYAIGSDFPVLDNGTCVATKPTDRSARTAIGYGANVVVMLASNYPATKKGLNKEDLCELLSAYGATNGVMMDGGPSSAMVVNGDLKNRLPFYAFPKYHSLYRYVANAIGVVQTCQTRLGDCSATPCCDGLTCLEGYCVEPLSSFPSPPPSPTLNAQIPADVTYHRKYDFTGPDTCSSCSDKPGDPDGVCARPGFELDIERRTAATDVSGLEATNYKCVDNSAQGFWDCFREWECIWQPGSINPSCVSTVDGTFPGVTGTCQEHPGVGIELGIPAGNPSSYGYNVAAWPREPQRKAFVVGSQIWVYAQFFLPTTVDVTARAGIDCTPTSDPNVAVTGVHTHEETATGTWHEVLMPIDPPVQGPFAVAAATQNCNAWLQCMNAAVWGPNAGDAMGGSCIISRLEVAGYRDFCDLKDHDLVLEVDDCAGCLLHHGFYSTWTKDEPGVFDGVHTRWAFSGGVALDACKKQRQFNVKLASGDPSGAWLIDDDWAPVSPTYPTASHVRKAARWLFVNKADGAITSTVPVGCDMIEPNVSEQGHHGNILVDTGHVTPLGMPDIPCSVP